MPTQAELKSDLSLLLTELRRRAKIARTNERYYDGSTPIPKAVIRAKMTKAYRVLMPMAGAPWGSVVVDSVADRLEVSGIRSTDSAADDAVWRAWNENHMDEESLLGHDGSLLNGRSFATIWPPRGDGAPSITLDSAEEMVVKYREGSRHERMAALRCWLDEDGPEQATLYRPDGTYKFRRSKEERRGENRFKAGDIWWERREVHGESWPLAQPLGEVPVVELGVNRRLKPGPFPYARGEFEHCWGLLDRINLLTFLGLVVALWMGFPLRGVVGEEILRDDDNNIIPPFDVEAGNIFQLEDGEAKIVEYKQAPRDNLSISDELMQLAYVTKTPAHLFPLSGGISNIAADTIRALEGGQNAKVVKHKGSLGAWAQVARITGKMLPDPVELPPEARIEWMDHENRSLAERADAASKLSSLDIPTEFLAERILNFSQEDIARIRAARAGGALDALLDGALNGESEPDAEPEPA